MASISKRSRVKIAQNEQWIDAGQTLVAIGFLDDDNEQIIYLPLSDFGLSARTLQNKYHAKVIVNRIASNRTVAVDVPIIEKKGKPWAKWVVYQNVTRECGIVTLQVKAINCHYRLLTSQRYRGIIFDRV